MQMVERIYELLFTLVDLCADTPALLAPTMLRSIALLAEFVNVHSR